MIHTGIVQYLSEIDTNIFLSFNGIHSPFWDYFMSSFTGKFIWIPMSSHFPPLPAGAGKGGTA